MWFNILKAKLVNVQSTGLKTTKPNVEEAIDGPCNRKLKEYYHKLKNTKFKTKSKSVNRRPVGEPTLHGIWYGREDNTDRMQGAAEYYNHKYTEIPEDVACKALDILSNATKLKSLKLNTVWNPVIINGYEIVVYWIEDVEESYKLKIMGLIIDKEGSRPLDTDGYVYFQIRVKNQHNIISNMDEIDVDWR
jgi:hypothetical protein